VFGLGTTDFAGNEIRRITMEIVRLDFDAGSLDFEVVIRVYSDGPMAEPCDVVQLEPQEGTVLDNGRVSQPNLITWDFAWEPCVAATDYELAVRGATASVDVLDVTIQSTSYRRETGGYVASSNLLGWTWKVRARVAGEWGA
jgi:hypothetical protein